MDQSAYSAVLSDLDSLQVADLYITLVVGVLLKGQNSVKFNKTVWVLMGYSNQLRLASDGRSCDAEWRLALTAKSRQYMPRET